MKNAEDKIEIILAQWQTCVEMANSISQRRDTMNNIFVTLNVAIIAAVSITWNIKSLFILIAGIVVCVIWLLFIRNYKLLNTEKFHVINSIEKNLPVQPFNDEWEKLKNNKKYTDGTKLEKTLPIMFIILYIVAVITIAIIKFC
ncbi:RipA family octameric membrane protein [Clostridium porci]|uniref:Uncharacterized protein n=2 Tax=Clostridium porci TaxID=2605778 RepID=A0A7X2NMI1_9CLOT|nr:hypothetical protein [Clostridium porci]MSS37637.1 hypothetical protein [Clostridium porci]